MADIPYSRPSLSDYQLVGDGPVPLFDFELRCCGDYVSFFHERRRIEEVYIESLVKLHRKIKSIDAFLDVRDRTELGTARVAWNEIRDNLEREAQARQAFLSSLTTDVIQPLTSVKETQERTRKRVKEDLKESNAAYSEYADVTLPKLKARYLKKFAEVEDHKRAEMMPPPKSPPPLPEPPALPQSARPAGPTAVHRPNVTAPQPLRPLDRRPSGSTSGPRNRSPSSSTAFSDLAHQGKKQLNTLIGLLDSRGASVKDGMGGGRENLALRNVRAKRELEDLDKAYRTGVHHLETLKLRRARILESGYSSVHVFVEEAAKSTKSAFERYTDNLIATTTTLTQLNVHARHMVDKISAERDLARLAKRIPKSLASLEPEPVSYEHGLVGACKDLIFGFSLVDYATSHNLRDGELPRIVKLCISEIDARGLESEGIYRVSGRHAIVQTLQRAIEKDEAAFEFHPQQDIYAIASLLKLFLRELPEPMFRFPLQDRIHHSEEIAEHQNNNFALLKAKIRRLPNVHQVTLKALVEHLSRVVALCDINKMDAKNVAIVFGGVIFGEDELPQGGDILTIQNWKDSLMEDMIIHSHIIFGDELFKRAEELKAEPKPEAKAKLPRSPTKYVHNPPPPSVSPTSSSSKPGSADNSPPLPPTPVTGEPPAPKYSYGSKRTKFAKPGGENSQDFTPRLPPRPNYSIHPSMRSGQVSPAKERMDPPAIPVASPDAPHFPEEVSPTMSDTDVESFEDIGSAVSNQSTTDTIPDVTTP